MTGKSEQGRPHPRRSLAAVAGQSAPAYGYTLAVWGSGASLSHLRGSPGVVQAILFVVGAVAAFGVIMGLGTRGLRHFDPVASHKALLLGGAFHILASGLAVACAALVGTIIYSGVAWPVGAFALTLTYFSLAGLQAWLASGF